MILIKILKVSDYRSVVQTHHLGLNISEQVKI